MKEPLVIAVSKRPFQKAENITQFYFFGCVFSSILFCNVSCIIRLEIKLAKMIYNKYMS